MFQGKRNMFWSGCIGFSLLCVAFSCGQQAFKESTNAAGVPAGSQWVHATPIDTSSGKQPGEKVLLNLNYVVCIATISFPVWRQLEFPVGRMV